MPLVLFQIKTKFYKCSNVTLIYMVFNSLTSIMKMDMVIKYVEALIIKNATC